MIILYDNEALNATITGTIDSDAESALHEPRLSSVAFTTGISSQYILFDHGLLGEAHIQYACLYASSLTDSATVILKCNSSDSWSSPDLSITLTENGGHYTGSIDFDNEDVFLLVDENGDYVIDENGDYIEGEFKYIYSYFRLTITDSNNAEAFLTIPWFFYGERLEMPGMNPGQIVTRKTTANASKSASGQLYGSKRLKPKSVKIGFTDFDQDKKEEIETFIDYCDIIFPFIVLIWENDLDVEAPIFMSLNDLPEIKRSTDEGLLWTTSIELEECF